MKTFRLDGVIADDSEIRDILDSFWTINNPDKIHTVNAQRSSESAFDIIVRHTGELVLPFWEEDDEQDI